MLQPIFWKPRNRSTWTSVAQAGGRKAGPATEPGRHPMPARPRQRPIARALAWPRPFLHRPRRRHPSPPGKTTLRMTRSPSGQAKAKPSHSSRTTRSRADRRQRRGPAAERRQGLRFRRQRRDAAAEEELPVGSVTPAAAACGYAAMAASASCTSRQRKVLANLLVPALLSKARRRSRSGRHEPLTAEGAGRHSALTPAEPCCSALRWRTAVTSRWRLSSAMCPASARQIAVAASAYPLTTRPW